MNTEHLYEFCVLAETLNYSRAAKKLYVSQGTLSKHIAELERELDAPLLLRSTHGVALTEAGRTLYLRAFPLLEKCQAAQSRIRIKNLSSTGVVRVACEFGLSRSPDMLSFMKRFMQHYPDVRIEMSILALGTPPGIAAEYDFVITPCLFEDCGGDIECRMLQSHGAYLAMPPGHRFMSSPSVRCADMAGETIIVPLAQEEYGPFSRNFRVLERSTHGKIVKFEVEDVPTAVFWANTGKGLLMLPRYAKGLLAEDVPMSGIAGTECRFDEYLYYNHTVPNEAAELFYNEITAARKAPGA